MRDLSELALSRAFSENRGEQEERGRSTRTRGKGGNTALEKVEGWFKRMLFSEELHVYIYHPFYFACLRG